MNRQEKIRLLSRVNRGKAVTHPFLADISEALGESIDETSLLPPSETDAITESFRAGYQKAIGPGEVSYRRFFRPDERNLVLSLADCLAKKLPSERGFFITKLDRDAGSVNLSVPVLLNHTASILRLDGDSLSVLSEDRKQGVLIDQNPDDPEQCYELVVWGDRWPLLALACDPHVLREERRASQEE